MAQAELTLKQHGFGQTRRRDLWWLQPLAVFTGLSLFVIYSTWAAFQGPALRRRAVSVAHVLAGDLRRVVA